MSSPEPSPADSRDWMTPVITFTLIPATVHFGLLVWLLNHADHPSMIGELLVGLILIGLHSPLGTLIVFVMNLIYFRALIGLCRRSRRPALVTQLLLGLLYPAPLMAAATILGSLGRVL